jgi:hypothetical protein
MRPLVQAYFPSAYASVTASERGTYIAFFEGFDSNSSANKQNRECGVSAEFLSLSYVIHSKYKFIAKKPSQRTARVLNFVFHNTHIRFK